jgi:glycosyltransferase involved in cell wall biosynthesis
MTTLRVIIDDMLSATPNGISRYTEDLTSALIEYAPSGCVVEGIVAASAESEYDGLVERLPGLAGLYKSSLARRDLNASWQHGFTSIPGGGMIHGTSLFAPLKRHDRINTSGNQTVVTIHDVVAWTHPESLHSRRVAWHKAMANRAHKYADAVVVPTHAVADALNEIIDFGERVRVISGAVSNRLTLGDDATSRATKLDLPEKYILTMGGLESRTGLEDLLAALALPHASQLPLLVVGPDESASGSISAAAESAGLPADKVRALGYLSDEDLSVVLDRATMLVFAPAAEGFGLPMLEAFSFGTPVIHSDAPALVEVAGDAGYTVAVDDREGYPQRLRDAIAEVEDDADTAARLSTSGLDRAGLFTWRSSAEKVWQLHADL